MSEDRSRKLEGRGAREEMDDGGIGTQVSVYRSVDMNKKNGREIFPAVSFLWSFFSD